MSPYDLVIAEGCAMQRAPSDAVSVATDLASAKRLVKAWTGKEPATNWEGSAGTAGGQLSGSGGTGVSLRWGSGGTSCLDRYFSPRFT